jgi:hypothetical protein
LRHDRITEELRELAALYALGSLTQHEAHGFELHLKEGCSICEAELRKLQRAAAEIGFAAPEITAPEYIRDLLSARIEREPQSFPTAGEPVQFEQAAVEIEEEPARFMAAPSFQLPESRRERHVLPWILVVVLLILGGFALYEWRFTEARNVHLEARISAAKTDIQNIRNELEGGKQDLSKLGIILNSFGKPGARISRLVVQTASPEILPTSSAAVVWDTEKDQCLVLGNFPPAPEGKRYQLWFFSQIAKVTAGAFTVTPTGPTFVTLPVPPEAAGATWAVVTLEPDNGSQIPTSPFYAKGQIQ